MLQNTTSERTKMETMAANHPVVVGIITAMAVVTFCAIILDVSFFSYTNIISESSMLETTVFRAVVFTAIAMFLIIKGHLLTKVFYGVKVVHFAIIMILSTGCILEITRADGRIMNRIAGKMAALFGGEIDTRILIIKITIMLICSFLFAVAVTAIIGMAKYLSSREVMQMSPDSNLRMYRFLGYALLMVMIAVLLIKTSSFSLEWDDIEWTIDEIVGKNFNGINMRLLQNGYNMPLYYWVLAIFYNGFARGYAPVFLPSMIAVVGGIILTSNVAKKLGGEKLKYITMAISSISVALMVQGGWRIRPYGFVFCFAALVLYTYINRLQKENWKSIAWYGLAMTLFLYAHWFGAIVILFYALCDLYLCVKKVVRFRCITSYLFAGGIFLIWFGLVLTNITHSEVNTWAARVPVFLSPLWTLVYMAGGCVLMVLPFLTAVLISKKKMTKDMKENIANKSLFWMQNLLSIIWTIIIVFFVSKFVSKGSSFYIDRYFFIILPQVVLLTAYGIKRIVCYGEAFKQKDNNQNGVARVFMVTIALIAAVNFSYAWIFASQNEGSFKGASEFLASQDNIHNSDVLVIGRKGARAWADYYFVKQGVELPANVVSYINWETEEKKFTLFVEQGEVLANEIELTPEDLLNYQYVYVYEIGLTDGFAEIMAQHFTLVNQEPVLKLAMYERN